MEKDNKTNNLDIAVASRPDVVANGGAGQVLGDVLETAKAEINSAKKLDERTQRSRDVLVHPRFDGSFGIRNELWVIPLVGCVNSQARAIVSEFLSTHKQLDHVDGVFAHTHPYGCYQAGEDLVRTRTLLQQMVKHPNCAGVVVLALGCEDNSMEQFVGTLGDYDKNRVRFLVAQDVDDEIVSGVKLLEELYQNAQNDFRVPQDLSCLKIGLKCGGVKGISTTTDNPILGMFSDYIVSVGGTTVVTEMSEIFGKEQLSLERCVNKTTFDKAVQLINDTKRRIKRNDHLFYENIPPQTNDVTISTPQEETFEEEKTLEQSPTCDAGSSDLLTSSGLNLLSGPSYEMVAVTNLGCVGCQLVLLTTSKGTPFGGFVPTIKISTDSKVAAKKSTWIDLDAGPDVQGDTFEDELEELIDFVIAVVNGTPTKNERYNCRDIALFKTGVTL